jgi:CheY-like chemotaxis protein
LPLQPPDLSSPGPARPPAAAETTVLVVDDSPVDRHLAEVLVAKSGCRAVSAGNGLEALAVLERERPGVVLTDLLMPEMDGLELVQMVRSRYPLVPVILMTAFGSEDVAIQALQNGAASYVPKKTLARDLPETLDQVLSAVRADRSQQRLLDCLTGMETEFRLTNDRTLIPPLIAHLQDDLSRLRLCDQTARIRVGIALEEAMLNGIFHGNLEVRSELRQEGDDAYYRQAEERRGQPPYRDRHITVRARLTAAEAHYAVRDEGPGFNPASLPDPTDPANLGQTSGRGLLLIRTFMDDVTYNPTGNEITMVKRRDPVGSGQ